MGLTTDLSVSSTLVHEVCHGEKESSWCERKGRAGLAHPRVALTRVILSLVMVLHLSDAWGSSALAGKRHMAEAVAELPEERVLLMEKVRFPS